MILPGAAAAVLAAMFCGAAPPGQERPDVADLLRAVANYIGDYEHRVSAVVSEEDYVQRFSRKAATERGVRRLKSDMLIINDDELGWIGFRDVYQVDGVPVRDRTERLRKLFMEPSSDSYDQAMRITNESARYNLVSDVMRTINIPMMALRFISADRQARSHFRIEDVRTLDGIRTAVVRFDEYQKPRVIQTNDDAAAHGRFWIEMGTGRVLRSELDIETASDTAFDRNVLSASVRAEYAYVKKIDLWMPVKMDEEYRVGGTLVEGRATYSNFRKFTVDTNTIIK